LRFGSGGFCWEMRLCLSEWVCVTPPGRLSPGGHESWSKKGGGAAHPGRVSAEADSACVGLIAAGRRGEGGRGPGPGAAGTEWPPKAEPPAGARVNRGPGPKHGERATGARLAPVRSAGPPAGGPGRGAAGVPPKKGLAAYASPTPPPGSRGAASK
jgi:hypothetical protein